MKQLFLKSKNLVLKLFLTCLGFTMAAGQCLAQYAAFYDFPTPSRLKGTLVGINDTISKFIVIINNKDTLQTSWATKYEFNYIDYSENSSVYVEVQQDKNQQKKYDSTVKLVGLTPKRNESEVEVEVKIPLKKSKK